MNTSNFVQNLVSDMGGLIGSTADTAATPLDKAFVVILSIDMVLWFFLPVLLLLLIWRISAIASQLGRGSAATTRMGLLLNDALREQTSAIHRLREKIEASLGADEGAIDKHRDGIQQGARDLTKVLERFDSHLQSGQSDIREQLATICDRLSKLLAARPGALDAPPNPDYDPNAP